MSDSEGASGDSVADLSSFDFSGLETRSGNLRASKLPHAHDPEGLQWELVGNETSEGESLALDVESRGRLVGRNWDELELNFEVTVTDDLYDTVVPSDEDGSHAILGIVYFCRSTILRDVSETVTVDGADTYELSVTLQKEDLRDSVVLNPALARSDSTGTDENYATNEGHRMAEGDLWTIELDHVGSLGSLLQPREKKFSEDDDFPDEDHLVFVDFERNPPRIFVNSDHERIVACLNSDSNQGWEASAREVLYNHIESQIWPQLILEAAAGISDDGDVPEEEWKRAVIEKFREPLYGEEIDYEDAVTNLREDTSSPERVRRLIQDIDDAVQTKTNPPSDAMSLLNLIDRR
ncbi:hypothetical protein SAMN04487947_2027 [Halogeometricum rufum]|uniref:Uncharacterized protein n=1 Tax=Halogeometricum rufum TaxID=553469 RepID=A0A1I6HGM0_9EURY|nr:hypothetical protein [Halogeometricum rufum]SFR53397.1 hypothetical protein SAMN04487947_2027 [Halogeometricum rufum]